MRERALRLAAASLLAMSALFAKAGDLRSGAAAPPRQLSPLVRGLLRPEVHGFGTEPDTRLEFWFRQMLPSRPRPSEGGIRVRYTALVPGELVGALRVSGSWSDARGQRVEPGVYVLRYAVQPLLKEHVGVSAYRDFLLLARAELDPGRAAILQDEATRLSRVSSRGSHPLVMSLRPADEIPAGPRVANGGDGEKILVAAIGGLRLAVVVSGGVPPAAPGGM